ncbi:MAG: hypothetical protein JW797_12840 [Bradymonadales bacterium]|nr:hypothetical protein [Bradymonadales bacterium]
MLEQPPAQRKDKPPPVGGGYGGNQPAGAIPDRGRIGAAGLPRPARGIGLRRMSIAGLVLITTVLGGRVARSQEELYDSLNLVEQRSVDRVLQQLGLQRDRWPEGKRFGALIVVNHPVFLDDLPELTWLNSLHHTTRQAVVANEVLWRAGDPYDAELVWETVRNLRQRAALSVVAMVPVISGDPERWVDILAVTRDTWSLRLGFQLEMTDQVIDELLVSLTEWNLVGRHKLVSLWGNYEQDTLELGPTYMDPRLFGTRLTLWERFGLVINHQTGEIEGSTNFFELALPLYRRDSRWGWRYLEQHEIGVERYFIGSTLRTYDNPDTTETERVPLEIDRRELDVRAEALAGLGSLDKHLFSLGYGLSVREYELHHRGVDLPTAQAFRRDLMPSDEFASFITLGYRFYSTRVVSLVDYQTYGFSEDIGTGHDVSLVADLGGRAIGADRDFLRAYLQLGYSLSTGGLVLESEVEIGGRLQVESSELIDQLVWGSLHLALPWWGPLRPHLGGEALVRFNRVYAGLKSVGGGEGLRGFPSGAFLGESALLGHLELRSRPIELFTVFWGLVVFFDAGSVFDEGDPLELLSDIGIGIRAVIPQLQKSPWRIDYAFPISGPYSFFPGVLTLGTQQVF